ncbi:MAG: hypothetical protein V3V15_11430 [Sphingorhabdus sp.]
MKLAGCLLASSLLLPVAAMAQGTDTIAPGAYQLPESQRPGAQELRNAMRRIARNRRNVDALIDAGNAALLLDDAGAALNFFRQAEQYRPGDGRVKAGLGAAYVHSENPFDALRYFDEAVKLGITERAIALDRGMAFDLLGNFDRAQQDYRLASTAVSSDRLTIQHAISLSLSGKTKEGDELLIPLLKKNSAAAWRARAFMLAARGNFRESRDVARGFLDARSAQRIERYLKQMPSLTGPQQAAAIHLGHFPARNAGRDSDAVRRVAANIPATSSGNDSRLIPAGKPLGAAPATTPAATPAAASAVGSSAPRPATRAPSLAAQRIAVAARASINLVAKPRPVPVPVRAAPPPVSVAASNLPQKKPEAGFDALPTKKQPDIMPATAKKEPAPVAKPVFPAVTKEQSQPALASAQPQNAPTKPVETPQSAEAAAGNGAATDLIPTPAPTPPPAAPQTDQKDTASLDNFDLGSIVDSISIPESEKQPSAIPVDLANLPTPSPKKKPVEAAPADKKAPDPAKVDENVSITSRHWVQIATGDIGAMRGEYRRQARKYAELFEGQQGWTSPWRTMGRLVVGPFDGYTAAKKWYDALKAAGGDGFVWKSAKGTKVTKLGGK